MSLEISIEKDLGTFKLKTSFNNNCGSLGSVSYTHLLFIHDTIGLVATIHNALISPEFILSIMTL